MNSDQRKSCHVFPILEAATGSCGQLADAATHLRFSMAYLSLALNRGGQGCAGVSLYQRGVYGRTSCSHYGRQVMDRTKVRPGR
jgi:hypothetical protein